jgi:hypothetical protein
VYLCALAAPIGLNACAPRGSALRVVDSERAMGRRSVNQAVVPLAVLAIFALAGQAAAASPKGKPSAPKPSKAPPSECQFVSVKRVLKLAKKTYGTNVEVSPTDCVIKGSTWHPQATMLQAFKGVAIPPGFNRWVAKHFNTGVALAKNCHYAALGKIRTGTYYVTDVCRSGIQQVLLMVRHGRFVKVVEGYANYNLPKKVLLEVVGLMHFR